jgi:hypothetical protein
MYSALKYWTTQPQLGKNSRKAMMTKRKRWEAKQKGYHKNFSILPKKRDRESAH